MSRSSERACRRAAPAAVRGLAAAIALLSAAQAHALRVTLDATQLGDPGIAGPIQFSRCGIFVSIVLGGDQLRNVQSEGFGIGGAGPDDAYVDGGEQIQLVFPEGGVRGVSYDVSSASDLDGDGLAGECLVRASDDEQLLGEALVSGEGPIDVSALFGDAPIRAILLTSASDGVRVGRISYQAPPFPVTLWLGSVTASHDGAEIDHCGIAFRGAPGLTHLGGGGIGVAGGTSDGIDAGEELEVDFGEPLRGVRYLPRALVSGDPGTTGVHSVEASTRKAPRSASAPRRRARRGPTGSTSRPHPSSATSRSRDSC